MSLFYPEEVCNGCEYSVFRKCFHCGREHLCICMIGVLDDIDECKGGCKYRKEKEVVGFESFVCEDGTIEANPVKTVELTCPKCGRMRQMVDLHDDKEKDEVMIEYCPFCKENC